MWVYVYVYLYLYVYTHTHTRNRMQVCTYIYTYIRTYIYIHIGDTLAVDTSFEGQLKTPIGCAVDGQNCLYVSEWGAHRIRRIQPDGSSVVCLGSNQRGLLGRNSEKSLQSDFT